MAQQKFVAALYIFFILSTHPVQAYRAREHVETFAKFADGQDLMAELHKAMHEEMHGQDMAEEYIGEWFATCEQRKEDFERRVRKTEQRFNTAMADGKMDIAETAWVTLKVRTVAKTFAKGEREKCAWVTDKSVDKSGLERIVAATAGKTKCFEAAHAHLESAKEGTAEEQGRAMKEAMTIYLSEDCTPQEVPETAEDGLDERAEEVDADDEAELLREAAEDYEKHNKTGALMEKFRLSGDKLLKAEGISPTEVSGLLQKQGAAGSKVESILLEQTEKLFSGNGLGEIFGKIFGFIFLCIAWVIFCWVLMAITMLILGLIMCVIKIIIVAILRLFRSNKWNFDYTGCVGWWLKGLGHTGHSSFGIALCAADMMMGRR